MILCMGISDEIEVATIAAIKKNEPSRTVYFFFVPRHIEREENITVNTYIIDISVVPDCDTCQGGSFSFLSTIYVIKNVIKNLNF